MGLGGAAVVGQGGEVGVNADDVAIYSVGGNSRAAVGIHAGGTEDQAVGDGEGVWSESNTNIRSIGVGVVGDNAVRNRVAGIKP